MWPTYWPTSPPCPPVDSVPADGVFYHLVSSNPLAKGGSDPDCRSKCEKKGLDAAVCCNCGACGISVFPTFAGALAQYRVGLKKFPWMAKKYWKFVAVARLKPEHGVVGEIGGEVSGHTNWWPPDALTVPLRCDLFTVDAPTTAGD